MIIYMYIVNVDSGKQKQREKNIYKYHKFEIIKIELNIYLLI